MTSATDGRTPALTVGSVVVGADDVPRALAFWTAALDYVPREEPEPDWVVLRPRSGPGVQLSLDRSVTPVQEQPRVHLDLYVEGEPARDAEVDRLVRLGAQRVDWPWYPDDPDFVVLADTEGNRFCVVDTAHEAG